MFAKVVRAHRQRLGLTQEELASTAGLSVRTIRTIEAGLFGRRPRPGTVRLLADAFGLVGNDRERFCQLAAGEQASVPGPTRPKPEARDADVASGSLAQALPRQLPTPSRMFTGRTRELGVLDAVHDSSTVVITTIDGMAGVGKTALAVHWAHRVADRFPDGQLYVNLRGFDPGGQVMEPAAAIQGFLDALGVPPKRVPDTLDSQAALYRSLLAGRRVLVVLDNARDAAQVRPLLPGAPGCLVVVTSRNQLASLVAAEAAHPITLDLLSEAEAHQLLARRLGTDRLAAEPDATQQIIAQCAGLPLALAIVAARAAAHPSFPLQALATELRETHCSLDAFTGEDAVTDVRAVFSWSYRTLTGSAARLFRFLGLHPGPDVGIWAVASLAGVPVPDVRPLLAELTRAHLLTEHAPGRYAFHDLLRAYAAELAHTNDPSADRHSATHRMLDHYLHTASSARRLLDPKLDPIALSAPRPGTVVADLPDHSRALSWFIAEHRVLLAAIRQAVASGFDTHTWQLAWSLTNFLFRRGQWHEHAAVQLAALAAAGRQGDRLGQANAHRNLAGAYALLSRYEDAHEHLRQALDLFEQLGDRAGQARTQQRLNWVLDQQGRPEAALHHARRALDLYRIVEDRAGQGQALNNIGWLHARLSDHHTALRYCRQALTMHQAIGNQAGEAATWHSLGFAHHHLGQYGEAVDCYQRALESCRDVGDRYNEAEVLTRLGDSHAAAGNPAVARAALRSGLAILQELDHPDADLVREKLRRLPHWRAAGRGRGAV